MRLEYAKYLAELLAPGAALREAIDEVRREIEGRSSRLVALNLSLPEDLAKAQALQGEIRGGLSALDRLEELISDAS